MMEEGQLLGQGSFRRKHRDLEHAEVLVVVDGGRARASWR
jgi:hypothetical protein